MPEPIPHIQQYTGVWSIEPAAATRFQQMLKSIKWSQHFAEFQARIDEGENPRKAGYELTAEGVAIIDLEGVLTKYGSSLSMGGSTVHLRKTLRDARDDAAVKSILLVIESPGGSNMGTPEAAAEVAATAKIKPVHAYIEDVGASAAYWIASQATRIVANASALVGSIGTYYAIDDVSKMFTKAGIKTHLFTTGPHKAAGYIGSELSETQQKEFQSLVEKMNAPFVAAVQAARNLDDDELAVVTDGRCWRGDEAVAVGLIDEVKSYDDVLAELSSQPAPPAKGSVMSKPRASTKTTLKSAAAQAKSEETEKKKEAESMEDEDEDMMEEEDEAEDAESQEDDEEEVAASKKSKAKTSKAKQSQDEKPASLKTLKAALPKASSDFIVEALESGWSVAQARMAWMEKTIASQAEEIETLKSTKPGASRGGGAKPLTTGKSGVAITGDAKALWAAAIKEKTDAGMNRAKAVSAVVREQPDLHSAYVEACNARA
jgi:signal peptide peptidase SppA